MYARAIGIAEETLGEDHPEVVSLLKNRAMLLKKQVRVFCYGRCIILSPIRVFTTSPIVTKTKAFRTRTPMMLTGET